MSSRAISGALNEATLLVTSSAIFFPDSSLPLEPVISLDGWLNAGPSGLSLQPTRRVRFVQQLDYLVESVLPRAGWYPAKDIGQSGQHGPYERWNLLVHRLHTCYDLRRILLVDTPSLRFRLGALGTHRTHGLSCPRR